MKDDKVLLGVKIDDPAEKLTKQIKVAMPKNYISEIDQIAEKMHVPKRVVIWDAVSNYIRICRRPKERS